METNAAGAATASVNQDALIQNVVVELHDFTGCAPMEPQQISERERQHKAKLQSFYVDKGLTADASKLGLPNPHLLLGITVQSALKMQEKVWKGYNREDHFASLGKEDWITKIYGPLDYTEGSLKYIIRRGETYASSPHCVAYARRGETGYDTAEAVKRFLRLHEYTDNSLAEVWVLQDESGVGKANVFVSHVQSEPLNVTLAANGYIFDAMALLWVDYFLLWQLQNDFDPVSIHSIIVHINKTLVVEDAYWISIGDEMSNGALNGAYLRRSFCLLEVACTPEGRVIFPLNEYRAEHAEYASEDEDGLINIFLCILSLAATQASILGMRWALDDSWRIVLIRESLVATYMLAIGMLFHSVMKWNRSRMIPLLIGQHAVQVAVLGDTVLIIRSCWTAGTRWWAGVLLTVLCEVVLACGLACGTVVLNSFWDNWSATYVNTQLACALRLKDKVFVDDYIKKHLGGFTAVNRRVTVAIKDAIVQS